MDYFTQQVIGMWTIGFGAAEIASHLDCSIEEVYNITDGLGFADLVEVPDLDEEYDMPLNYGDEDDQD